MKSKQIFWGSLLITLGALFLINNAVQLEFAWHFLWKLWPAVFIVWGISALTQNMIAKRILAGLKAVILAVVIFAGFKSSWCSWDDVDFNDNSVHYEEQVFAAPYNKDSETATFDFKAGAGKFTIRDVTEDELFSADAHSSINDFVFETDSAHNEVRFYMKDSRHFKFNSGSPKNIADIKLNRNPLWDMDIDIGAASGNFDFSDYKIKDLRINTGASSLNIKLGDKQQESHVDLKTGVSSINITVPSSVGCEITSKTGLASKRYNGFKEAGSGKYKTDNYDSSKKKLYLSIDAGVSSINVSRY